MNHLVETSMEEIEPVLKEKYVVEHGEESIIIAYSGTFRLSRFWCKKWQLYNRMTCHKSRDFHWDRGGTDHARWCGDKKVWISRWMTTNIRFWSLWTIRVLIQRSNQLIPQWSTFAEVRIFWLRPSWKESNMWLGRNMSLNLEIFWN